MSDRNGEIAADSEQGMFCADTRFVSSYRIFANGEPWLLLTSGTPAYYFARVHLINRAFDTAAGAIAHGTLVLSLTRAAEEGIHEDLEVANYAMPPAHFNLEIALRSDFADLFEVKVTTLFGAETSSQTGTRRRPNSRPRTAIVTSTVSVDTASRAAAQRRRTRMDESCSAST